MVKRFLGRGAYGSVCEAYDKVTKRRVAIKRISDLFDVRENAKRIFREVQILRLLDHPMIVKILHLHMPATKSFNDLYATTQASQTQPATVSHACHVPLSASATLCLSAWTRTLGASRVMATSA